MSKSLRLVVLAVLAVSLVSVSTLAQVVITDDANTSSFFAKTNFGSSIALIVCSGSNTYVKFSFANLGPGITRSNVSKATLILYVDYVLTSGTMDVYQVNGSWTEGKITYNNAPALGTKLFSAVSVTSPGYLSLDLTSTVEAWLNGTLANNGVALVPSSGSSIAVSFDSKENILTSHTAQLPLVLVSAGPQGAQGPAGPQGPQGTTGAQGPVGPSGAAGATGSQGPQGVMGLTGATGSQGPVGPAGANGTGFNFRNAFDNSASYGVNDVVTYNGSSYVASAASSGPNNPTPDTNAVAWSIMAAQGTAGAAGAAGAQGQPGPQGQQGAQGAQGPSGANGIGVTVTALSVGDSHCPNGGALVSGASGNSYVCDGTPGSETGALNGFQEFTTSGTFAVPSGITHILIEMWGAGGGGGGPDPLSTDSAGGGGAGGYTRAVVLVTPGATYNVIVGAGGLGVPRPSHIGPGANGGNGGASQLTDSSSAMLVSAQGGSGGMGVSGGPGAGGSGGSGSGPATNTTGRNGGNGMAGQSNQQLGGGGAGGIPASGSISTNGASFGGAGGDINDDGKNGGSGYVLIAW